MIRRAVSTIFPEMDNSQALLADRIVIEHLNQDIQMLTAYDQLRPMERVFVDEYLTVLDPRIAARQALQSAAQPERGGVAGVELMRRPMVQAAIAEGLRQRRERYNGTNERIRQELEKLAFSTLSDYIRLTPQGEPYYDLNGISAEAMAAIAEIKVEDVVEGRGDDTRTIRKVTLKLYDKRTALADLAKMNGIMPPDTALSINVRALVVNGSVEELANAYAQELAEDE